MKSIPTENGVLVHKTEIKRQQRDNEWPRDGESWPKFFERLEREARKSSKAPSRKVSLYLAAMFLVATLGGAVVQGWIPF